MRARCAQERIAGTDLIVVRELTGGIYFGAKTRTADYRERSLRVQRRRDRAHRPGRVPGGAHAASRASTRRTCSRPRGCGARSSRAFTPRSSPASSFAHLLVDNAAMALVSAPASFDVIVTENMFGDILSDEAAMITGSIGMLPSASLGDGGPGPVRAGARLSARHRRAGHRQPAGDVPVGRADAAARAGVGKRRPSR